ncbi:unnamed protein product [Pseudo-nitzschia multistriata]|uniref:Uncharacterized protein n=1 Tax=Pseudo-nitzschia multistriata TaxID=183589 RepID=A0A448ZE55_9STRA|nr:unnamed protein product [Pseudo-nitzschia multistriata]
MIITLVSLEEHGLAVLSASSMHSEFVTETKIKGPICKINDAVDRHNSTMQDKERIYESFEEEFSDINTITVGIPKQNRKEFLELALRTQPSEVQMNQWIALVSVLFQIDVVDLVNGDEQLDTIIDNETFFETDENGMVTILRFHNDSPRAFIDVPMDIVHFKSLTTLVLQNPRTIPIQQLSELMELEDLVLWGVLSETSVDSTEGFRPLCVKNLNLNGSNASESLLEWVGEALPDVKTLALGSWLENDDVDRWLHVLKTSENLQKLETLEFEGRRHGLTNTALGVLFLEALPRFRRLRTLCLGNSLDYGGFRCLNAKLGERHLPISIPLRTIKWTDDLVFVRAGTTYEYTFLETEAIRLGRDAPNGVVREVAGFLRHLDTITGLEATMGHLVHPAIEAELSRNRAGRHWIERASGVAPGDGAAPALLPLVLALSSGAPDPDGLFYAVRSLLPPLAPALGGPKEPIFAGCNASGKKRALSMRIAAFCQAKK